MSDEDRTASTAEVQALPRRLIHKVLETELGKNWRSIRWWVHQFTPVSTSVLGIVLTAAGTWIVNLSHKVDNQGTKIVVLETEIVPDLRLTNRVIELEKLGSNHEGRIQANERALGNGKFNYADAVQAAAEVDAKRKAETQKGNRRR